MRYLLAKLSLEQKQNAIQKIDRGLEALHKFDVDSITNGTDPKVSALSSKLSKIITDIYGNDTHEYLQYHPSSDLTYINLSLSQQNDKLVVKEKIERAIAILKTIKEGFVEELNDLENDSITMKAYEGLDLHPRISIAASTLYKNQHYSNAIEDAVKALCQFIREKTGLNIDGVPLMQITFSPKKPILRFNKLADDSDINEQKGFMDWFSGTISALRNPRAHKLITDDPKMALESIAFVSFLAKLVDKAYLCSVNASAETID